MSQSSVSLVLSGKWAGRVAPSTAERVRRAAAELAYQPDPTARSLRLERTGSVLLVVPALSNPFFAHLHAGAVEVASRQDIGVLIHPISSEEGQDPLPLPRHAIDGMLIYGLGSADVASYPDRLPRVPMDCDPRLHPDTVNADAAAGTREAARHLLGLGHRSLGYLHVTRRGAWSLSTRLRCLRALVRHHPEAEITVRHTTFALAEARRAALALLSRTDRPTALICEDDNLAVAAFGAAQQLGLRVPRDLSVIGYNNLPVSEVLGPRLTTVDVPSTQLGATAMRALLDRMAARPAVRSSPLPTSLVIRESTAPAPHR